VDEPDWTKLLSDLRGDDERRADRALTQLRTRSISGLRSYLYRCNIKNSDLIEDLIQDAFMKVWLNRKKFAIPTYQAWISSLHTIALRCYVDSWRKQQQEKRKFDELVSRVPDRDLRSVVAFLQRLYEADGPEYFLGQADELWLGVDGELPIETRRMQALAAQLYYLDDWSCSEIVEAFRARPGACRLTERMLEASLKHPGVIRALAFNELYFSNDRLVWHLLGMSEPVEPKRLADLSRAACADGSHARTDRQLSAEATVILWRYRHAMKPEDILRRKDCPCSEEHLFSLLASLTPRLPFNSCMTTLLTGLTPHLGADQTRNLLAYSGLWQRLAFQYYYGEELARNDVCIRLEEPAAQVGYTVNTGNLNVWLSGKRLIQRLVKHCPILHGDDAHG
jgi:DNA-directed RNA polymerase specialized sigma24 family protein